MKKQGHDMRPIVGFDYLDVLNTDLERWCKKYELSVYEGVCARAEKVGASPSVTSVMSCKS